MGERSWEVDWPDLDGFHVFDGAIYAGGSHARRIDVASGRLIAEQHFGEDLHVLPPLPSGPVYADSNRVFAVHPNDLSILWQVPDPNEELFAHGNRLCRYRRDGKMSHIDLATLRESDPVQAPPPPTEGAFLHAHVDDLWCVFYVSEGGRCGIDEGTGDVRWQHDDPWGYGLLAFGEARAYATRSDGGISAYDLRTGKCVWRQPCAPQPRELRPVHLLDGRLYAATCDGMAVVIDTDRGDVLLRGQVDLHQPEVVRPLGESQLVVGAKNAIGCYQMFEGH